MVKEEDLLFTVSVGMTFGVMGEHESLMVAFLSLSSHTSIGRDHGPSEEASW